MGAVALHWLSVLGVPPSGTQGPGQEAVGRIRIRSRLQEVEPFLTPPSHSTQPGFHPQETPGPLESRVALTELCLWVPLGGPVCAGEPPAALLPHTSTPTSKPPLFAQALLLSQKPTDKRPFHTEARLSPPVPGHSSRWCGSRGRWGQRGRPSPPPGRNQALRPTRLLVSTPEPQVCRPYLAGRRRQVRQAGCDHRARGCHPAGHSRWMARGSLQGMEAGGGPAGRRWSSRPPKPRPYPNSPVLLGPRQTVYHIFFLFPFLLPPTPLPAWGSVLFLLERHPMPILKRTSAIFQNGQVGTQLQAHSRAFTWGVDPPLHMSDLSWDLPCTSGALRVACIPKQGPGGPWSWRSVQAGRSCRHRRVKPRPEGQRGLPAR